MNKRENDIKRIKINNNKKIDWEGIEKDIEERRKERNKNK